MAIAVTPVPGSARVSGNFHIESFDLVFSGNYATGGESFPAGRCGVSTIIEMLIHGGVAVASALSSGTPISYDYPTSKFVLYEGAASAAPLLEKDNAEAYVAGTKIRVTVTGF